MPHGHKDKHDGEGVPHGHKDKHDGVGVPHGHKDRHDQQGAVADNIVTEKVAASSPLHQDRDLEYGAIYPRSGSIENLPPTTIEIKQGFNKGYRWDSVSNSLFGLMLVMFLTGNDFALALEYETGRKRGEKSGDVSKVANFARIFPLILLYLIAVLVQFTLTIAVWNEIPRDTVSDSWNFEGQTRKYESNIPEKVDFDFKYGNSASSDRSDLSLGALYCQNSFQLVYFPTVVFMFNLYYALREFTMDMRYVRFIPSPFSIIAKRLVLCKSESDDEKKDLKLRYAILSEEKNSPIFTFKHDDKAVNAKVAAIFLKICILMQYALLFFFLICGRRYLLIQSGAANIIQASVSLYFILQIDNILFDVAVPEFVKRSLQRVRMSPPPPPPSSEPVVKAEDDDKGYMEAFSEQNGITKIFWTTSKFGSKDPNSTIWEINYSLVCFVVFVSLLQFYAVAQNRSRFCGKIF